MKEINLNEFIASLITRFPKNDKIRESIEYALDCQGFEYNNGTIIEKYNKTIKIANDNCLKCIRDIEGTIIPLNAICKIAPNYVWTNDGYNYNLSKEQYDALIKEIEFIK